MFGLLGTVFGFVSSDVTSKLAILEHHRHSEQGKQYQTISSMTTYEVSNNLTRVKSKPPSGSRTLLRLHRALNFIIKFLQGLKTVKLNDGLSSLSGEVYNVTLANYHTWIIRKTVGLALYTLPTRKQLMERMHFSCEETAVEQVDELIKHLEPIYNDVQMIYKDNDILNLP